MSDEKKEIEMCKWSTLPNKDFVVVSCTHQKVNFWKLCKRRHLLALDIFKSCPWCKKPVKLD